mmetsp:Transcript_8394/g.18403  ORF Transcript_8394/g.18403 Transcript_8394/m.18403 type:complete len:202 (-) Transcript_8394:164-769(-)
MMSLIANVGTDLAGIVLAAVAIVVAADFVMKVVTLLQDLEESQGTGKRITVWPVLNGLPGQVDAPLDLEDLQAGVRRQNVGMIHLMFLPGHLLPGDEIEMKPLIRNLPVEHPVALEAPEIVETGKGLMMMHPVVAAQPLQHVLVDQVGTVLKMITNFSLKGRQGPIRGEANCYKTIFAFLHRYHYKNILVVNLDVVFGMFR